VVVWDVATGKQLTRIEAGYPYRGWTEHFFVSPDWKTVYAMTQRRRVARQVEKDGKRLLRLEFDSDVREWDLSTGELRGTFQHTPPRGVEAMALAPDGLTFVTVEELPGESEGVPESAVTLWDVRSRQPRPLSDHLSWRVVYSPDGKTLVGPVYDEERRRVNGLQWIDVATARRKAVTPVTGEDATMTFPQAFSSDGRLLIGESWSRKPERWRLKFWDAATGQEVAGIEAPEKEHFWHLALSPDGRTCAATTMPKAEQAKLFLFDLAGKRLAKTIILGEKAIVDQPAFSPDGRWLAVTTQVVPDDQPGRDPDAEELPQPRVHLFDVVAGQLRETLIAPPGIPRSACFSPDGKTLGTSGNGRVLLWDLTKPPLGVGGGGK
jgi:WD40-like Beta Propeller Repeat